MKTLYEVLEVSENASKEIIEKAYKVLAKKYHPDLQTPENKPVAEKKMKEINEAYGILSDEIKRREYDTKLANERQAEELQKSEKQESDAQANSQANYGTNYQEANNTQRPMTEAEYIAMEKMRQEEIKQKQEIQRNMQAQYEQKYQEAYENYLRSLGYKIKYKWTWKNYKDFFITILIIIGICAFLWLFPPTNKLIVDFYNSNAIFKTIIDIIGNIFKGIWNAIRSIFS